MSNKRTIVLSGLLACVVALTLLVVWPEGGSFRTLAAQLPMVYTEPTEISASRGQEVGVTVRIEGAEDVGGFQLDLLFPAGVLQATGVELDEFISSTGRTLIPLGPVIDNQAGKITFGAATAGEAPGLAGDGSLAHVTFRAVGDGSGTVAIKKLQLLDTKGKPVRAAVRGSTVGVRGSPVPAGSPRLSTPTRGLPATATPLVEESAEASFDIYWMTGIGALVFIVIGLVFLAQQRRQKNR